MAFRTAISFGFEAPQHNISNEALFNVDAGWDINELTTLQRSPIWQFFPGYKL